MKRAVALMVLLCAVTLVYAQTLKIAFVDVERVFQSSKEKVMAEDIFKKEAQDAQKKVEDAYKTLMEQGQKFQNEAAFMQKEEQEKKRQELMKKQEEFEKMRNEMSNKVEQRRNELMKPIMTSITTIVTNIRKEKGYDVIFEKSAVISGNDQLDVTDMVIERINAGK